MDQQLAEIQERMRIGFVTEDDILHLYERAKQAQVFQERYEEALDTLEGLQGQIDELRGQISELEDNVYIEQ